MKQTQRRPIDLKSLKIGAVLNTSSGSCDEACAGKIGQIMEAAQIVPVAVELVEGKGVEAALDKLLAQQIDLLIVLGGNGTIRAAAERCAQSKTRLIPLPGGTMNMLPRALYGEGTWSEILSRTLAAPVLIQVGGGEVESHRFFCAGIFGSPALWAEAREAARENRWLGALDAVFRAWRRTFSRKIRYRFDGARGGAVTAVAVICPLVSAALPSDARAFETAILDPDNVGDAVHLAWTAFISDWRKDRNVKAVRADRVEVLAGRPIPAILDGERVMLPRRTTVRFVDDCFAAVVPSGEPGAAV